MKTNHYIYVLRLQEKYQHSNWPEADQQIIAEHFKYLKDLTEEGKAVLVGKSQYPNDHADNFGICIFEAAGEDQARKIMENDPAIKNGIMNGKLHPFSLALLRKKLPAT